ncbi:hypothetical protein HZA33_05145 [Candidatus Pacearchaeota archaeon]|nr:hypothetical protein [Candidatus Pacearchaeota archaeon]
MKLSTKIKLFFGASLLLFFFPSPLYAQASSENKPKKIESLYVKNIEIRDFFSTLENNLGEKIVVDENVEGTVTADLKDVTLEQILGTLKYRDIEYTKNEEGYHVFKKEAKPEQRVYLPTSYRTYSPVRRLHLFEPKYLDAVQVSQWFGGFALGASPAIRPVATPGGFGTGGYGNTQGQGFQGGQQGNTGFGNGLQGGLQQGGLQGGLRGGTGLQTGVGGF